MVPWRPPVAEAESSAVKVKVLFPVVLSEPVSPRLEPEAVDRPRFVGLQGRVARGHQPGGLA